MLTTEWSERVSGRIKEIKCLLYSTSVLLQNTRLVKFIRNSEYIQDSSGVSSISSLVKISMVSLISRFSLKLYLNSLVCDRDICVTFLEVFSNLRQSSEFFGKFSGTIVWPSEQFWKIFGDLRKVVGNLQKIVKNAVISMPI